MARLHIGVVDSSAAFSTSMLCTRVMLVASCRRLWNASKVFNIWASEVERHNAITNCDIIMRYLEYDGRIIVKWTLELYFFVGNELHQVCVYLQVEGPGTWNSMFFQEANKQFES